MRGTRFHFLRDLVFVAFFVLFVPPDFFVVPPLFTLLPLRPSLRSLPASISCSYAPRTTFLATFSVLASSRSLGSKVPAANSPASMSESNCSRIWRVIDSGLFRLTRTFSLLATVMTPFRKI